MRSLPKRVQAFPIQTVRVGEIVITSDDVLIHSALGTCVAVTLYDPVTKRGGICHALMPNAPLDHGHPLRYVDRSVEAMLEGFASAGVPFDRLHARVVGGVIRQSTHPKLVPIGERNALQAIVSLKAAGIKVHSKHTGGDVSRKIYFVPSSGELFVRALPKPTLPGK